MRASKLISMKALCDELETSRASVNRWILKGMPCVSMPNGRFMFRVSDILEWSAIESGKTNPNELRSTILVLVDTLKDKNAITDNQYKALLVRLDYEQPMEGMFERVKSILEGVDEIRKGDKHENIMD